MTNRYTSANTTTAELAANYFDQPDRIATIGRIHRRLRLASRAQRLHGIHALTKVFRDLGPVPTARRKVIAALGGTAVAWPLTWPRAACARQPERMRRIGVLMPFSADDQEVTAVDPSAAAAPPDKRLSPGDVIVEVQYQSVGNPADLQNRVDQLKEQGEKVAVLLVSNADAETRFVALSLQ